MNFFLFVYLCISSAASSNISIIILIDFLASFSQHCFGSSFFFIVHTVIPSYSISLWLLSDSCHFPLSLHNEYNEQHIHCPLPSYCPFGGKPKALPVIVTDKAIFYFVYLLIPGGFSFPHSLLISPLSIASAILSAI